MSRTKCCFGLNKNALPDSPDSQLSNQHCHTPIRPPSEETTGMQPDSKLKSVDLRMSRQIENPCPLIRESGGGDDDSRLLS
eukprot:3932167-Rhodomonas_salina.2